MNINQDNYEEYFLLFADNELSEEERSLVEDFVKQNTALEEEFLTIKMSVLKPDKEVKLAEKDFLLRQSEMGICAENYSRYFILYHDNELTAGEQKETLAFLSQNPSLQLEFEQFQKSKLPPDHTITFYHKELLFRREDKVKVIRFGWWKAVAAAVLVGTMGIMFYFFRGGVNNVPVIVTNVDKSGKVPITLSDTANVQEMIATKQSISVHSPSPKKELKTVAAKNAAKIREHGDLQVSSTPGRRSLLPAAVVQKATPAEVTVNKDQLTNDLNAPIEKATQPGEEIQFDVMMPEKVNEIPEALPASYVSAESDNSSNYAFYNITEEKFNKSKVGGFIRKIKRIIGRKIVPLNSSRDQREMVDN